MKVLKCADNNAVFSSASQIYSPTEQQNNVTPSEETLRKSNRS